MTVESKGADRLASTLAAAGRQLADLNHTPAGQIIAQEARKRAPRGPTGRLAAGHRVADTPGGVQVTNPVRYAIPQHQGWAGHQGRPWLTAAAQATQPRWLGALENQTQQILNTVHGA